MESKKLPVGIDSFENCAGRLLLYRQDRIDPRFVEQLGRSEPVYALWRFGKTLNMSMLKSFSRLARIRRCLTGFDLAGDGTVKEYQGKFPVVFVSPAKGVDGLTFEDAYEMLRKIVVEEASRFQYLLESPRITEADKCPLRILLEKQRDVSESDIAASFRMLSKLLYQHYGQKTVLLIDEYDVPLDKAFHHGYYREMVALIRGLFGQALKTNEYLHFAVLTGCLRVAKESIFTGLNNFKVLSIIDPRFDEHFGFSDAEVKRLLADYGLESHFDEIKEWYDGYRFGDVDVYCPWDVVNHVDLLRAKPDARPQAFLINTSGNDMVKRFVDKAEDKTTQQEIERLIDGEAITKAVQLELTYDEVDRSIDNLWSVLFTTGYLTFTGVTEDGRYKLVIPNREVREVFVRQIHEWFKERVVSDAKPMRALHQAFLNGGRGGRCRGTDGDSWAR